MPKQVAKAEINSFVKGFFTEASPLNFPPDAAMDEENFQLNIDGSRNRRLGIDFEENYELKDTGHTPSSITDVEIASFNWPSAGGVVNNDFVVLQFGNRLDIYKTTVSSLSSEGYVGTVVLDAVSQSSKLSIDAVDGRLVIAAGVSGVYVIEYEDGVFSKHFLKLLTRDLWGVYSGSPLNKYFRPKKATEYHVYNLRNQGWAIPRRGTAGKTITYTLTPKTVAESGEVLDVDVSLLGNKFTFSTEASVAQSLRDPIEVFRKSKGKFPAITESVWTGINYQAGEAPMEVMFPNLYDETFGDNPDSAKGFFIIDALNRGQGRLDALAAHYKRFPEIVWKIVNIPTDVTSGGPTIVSAFAGRIFYAGFNGEVTGGDENSPNLSNYIFFSQLVKNRNDLKKCYQEGDPTSRESSDILDTDGGFIKIAGARNIIGMVNIGAVLVVIADNGVWLIKGGSDYGFTASNYISDKISSFGSRSPYSIVSTGDAVFYWGDTGIYVISKNQFGDYVVDNLTLASIQKYYNSIDKIDKEKVIGIFDELSKQVRWMFNMDKDRTNANPVFELIFDLKLKAFTKYKIYPKHSNSPDILGYIQLPAFINNSSTNNVVIGTEQVESEGIDVILSGEERQASSIYTKYLVLHDLYASTNVGYTFAELNNTEFKDWGEVDAFGYLLIGTLTGGDASAQKQSPYLTMHFMRTESGVEEVNGELVPAKQSGCLVRSQWEWANSVASNKWSPQFQAYKYRRPFFITDAGDDYDNGFQTVVSKNKLRGRGRALSLYITTEPAKDCHILGWSYQITGNQI